MVGSWEVNVITDAMPQKVATAIGKLAEQLMGASYSPIAYLGSQVVNGTNHAVLAEQTLITAKPVKNIVVIIFNEKPGAIDLDLVAIEQVLQGGDGYGGVRIDVEVGDKINKTAQRIFDEKFAGFVGTVVTPFAFLGTQMMRGLDYIYACEVSPVVDNDPKKKVAIVRINEMEDSTPVFTDLLGNPLQGLNYAFSW